MSADLQPSSVARWPISATCVAESRPTDHSSSNLVRKGLDADEDVDDGQLCSSPLARAITAFQPLSLFGGLLARHLLARLQKAWAKHKQTSCVIGLKSEVSGIYNEHKHPL